MPADRDPFPPPKKLTLKRAEFTTVNEPASAPPSDTAPDAMEILRINREREIAAGRDNFVPVPAPRRSRRVREYWTILLAGNLAIGLAYWLDPSLITFCVAGALIFTGGITWVMFFVMEDY
jgi:hypothetical protein